MRVVEATQLGEPEVLVIREAPAPVAGAGEAVVDVSVVPVLFLDTQIRLGAAKWFPVKPPYVPGVGIAGRVVSVGDGVDRTWIGREVISDIDHGGYVERAAVPADGSIAVPGGLGVADAAALLHDGRTALGLADDAQIQPGESVLVVGAAGGLGLLLVQLAHASGARVIAAARGERKLALARDQGADTLVDYSEPGWDEQVLEATGGSGADVVFDGVGAEIGRAAFQVTSRAGRFSAHGAPGGQFAEIHPQEAERRRVTIRGIERVQFTPAEGKRLTERALSEAAAGRIRPVIGQTFPLERADAAHEAIEGSQVTGKTLLLTNRPA
jgi:NADPH2:quinone reductase